MKSLIKHNSIKILVIFFLTILMGFQISAQTRNEDGKTNFTTLMMQRDSVGKVSIVQDERMDDLLERHVGMNESSRGMYGYQIQIYSGSDQRAKRDAQKAKIEFAKLYPDIEVEIVYEEPYYKTRVGAFRTKLEGYKTYKQVAKHFPNCYFVIAQNMKYPSLD